MPYLNYIMSLDFHRFQGLSCNFIVWTLICIFLLNCSFCFYGLALLSSILSIWILVEVWLGFASLEIDLEGIYLFQIFSLSWGNIFRFFWKGHLIWSLLWLGNWLFHMSTHLSGNAIYVWSIFSNSKRSHRLPPCS